MEAIIFVVAVILIVYVLTGIPAWWDDVTDGGFEPHPFIWSNQSTTPTGSVLEAIYCARCYKRYDHRIHRGQGVESYEQRGATAPPRPMGARLRRQGASMIGNEWTVCEYDVILEHVGDRRVEVMRALRQSIDMPQLACARDMLEGLPRVVLAEADAERAFTLAWHLAETGSGVRVIQHAREYSAACWAGDEGPTPISETMQEVPAEWWQNFR